jgi:hypothetical protein
MFFVVTVVLTPFDTVGFPGGQKVAVHAKSFGTCVCHTWESLSSRSTIKSGFGRTDIPQTHVLESGRGSQNTCVEESCSEGLNGIPSDQSASKSLILDTNTPFDIIYKDIQHDMKITCTSLSVGPWLAHQLAISNCVSRFIHSLKRRLNMLRLGDSALLRTPARNSLVRDTTRLRH